MEDPKSDSGADYPEGKLIRLQIFLINILFQVIQQQNITFK